LVETTSVRTNAAAIRRVWNLTMMSCRSSRGQRALHERPEARLEDRRLCASARARSVRVLKRSPGSESTAARSAAAVGSWKSTPVSPWTTVSAPPPSPKATAGLPQAMASSGTIPKSSTPGMSTARQRR
jgi:hypothetical protein